MKPTYSKGRVVAQCPSDECKGALTTYEEFNGNAIINFRRDQKVNDVLYTHQYWKMLRCANCHSGGLVKVLNNDGNTGTGRLDYFYPLATINTSLPESIPDEIKKEYREAEKCASVEAYRAASALLRSTLEKVLKLNGYKNSSGGLEKKIEIAAQEGLLTESLRRKAHEKTKVLGDDVLHEDYRVVTAEEVNESLKYTARVIEEFYEERKQVEEILIEKKRIVQQPK